LLENDEAANEGGQTREPQLDCGRAKGFGRAHGFGRAQGLFAQSNRIAFPSSRNVNDILGDQVCHRTRGVGDTHGFERGAIGCGYRFDFLGSERSVLKQTINGQFVQSPDCEATMDFGFNLPSLLWSCPTDVEPREDDASREKHCHRQYIERPHRTTLQRRTHALVDVVTTDHFYQ
jgi:hypothetical protein